MNDNHVVRPTMSHDPCLQASTVRTATPSEEKQLGHPQSSLSAMTITDSVGLTFVTLDTLPGQSIGRGWDTPLRLLESLML